MSSETMKAPPKIKTAKRGGFRPIPANERLCKVCGGPMLPGPNVTVCSPKCAKLAGDDAGTNEETDR